tara:strand:+ start:540 stop:869 length:330 start_codon:yes stop_codon:yes gene_type:complete
MSNYKKYLEYSWKYAKLYKIYESEVELYNNIRESKIKEYRNKYIELKYTYQQSNSMSYNIVHKSVTLKKQYVYMNEAKKNYENIELIYNKLYDLVNSVCDKSHHDIHSI